MSLVESIRQMNQINIETNEAGPYLTHAKQNVSESLKFYKEYKP